MQSMAVIPARGGSTRLNDKNIYPLGGKPLIRWITQAVIDSGCFDRVVIATDSDKIFDAVSDMPVERHVIPEHLAALKSTALSAMMNLLDQSETLLFSYFLPTCPFVSSNDITNGVSKLLNEPCDTVISMTEFFETMQLACLMSDDKVVPLFDNLEQGNTNSNFLKKYYKPSGAFYMGYKHHLFKTRSFFKGNVRGVIIPKKRSVDINTIEDIKYAESLL